jgi:hypothetical protein
MKMPGWLLEWVVRKIFFERKGAIEMRVILWIIQLFIPLVVLYSIGYYLPGFSALTIPWIVLLALLIFLGNLAIQKVFGGISKPFGRIVIDFLVATIIIFTVTLAIYGGSVPLGGAAIAALIIAGISELIYPEKVKRRSTF